jgi:hypothetical protein
MKSDSKENRRKYQRNYRTTPHPCDCGRDGVKWTPTGWSCARCVELNARVDNIVSSRPMRAETEKPPSTFWAAWYEYKIPVGSSLAYLDTIRARIQAESTQLQAA